MNKISSKIILILFGNLNKKIYINKRVRIIKHNKNSRICTLKSFVSRAFVVIIPAWKNNTIKQIMQIVVNNIKLIFSKLVFNIANSCIKTNIIFFKKCQIWGFFRKKKGLFKPRESFIIQIASVIFVVYQTHSSLQLICSYQVPFGSIRLLVFCCLTFRLLLRR